MFVIGQRVMLNGRLGVITRMSVCVTRRGTVVTWDNDGSMRAFFGEEAKVLVLVE
jgi:hypothetical protein